MIGSAIATVIAQMMAALLFDVFSSKTQIGFFMKLKTLYFADVFQRG
jgi:Na+-driven multidrug efflux pump